MANKVSLETGKLGDSNRISFMSTTFQIIKQIIQIKPPPNICHKRAIRQEICDVTEGINPAQADDVP